MRFRLFASLPAKIASSQGSNLSILTEPQHELAPFHSIFSSPLFAERNVMEYPAHSFRLDVRRPDYLAPLLGFVGDELGEVGRRARKHRRAQIGNPRLHLGISEPSVYFFVEFVDYLRRRALGRTEAAPEARLVAR